jgi:hypothetical protein
MSWEYFSTTHYETALEKAVELGWKDKSVQVRVEFREYVAHYMIEPFERDCNCRYILKYNEHIRP